MTRTDVARGRAVACLALVCLATGAAAGPADFVPLDPAARLPAPLAAALPGVAAPALRDHIAWLSAPAREGRGLGTAGLAAAQDYVVDRLVAAGVGPLHGTGRDAYRQVVPLRRVRAPGGAVAATLGDARLLDARALDSAVLTTEPPGEVTGPLVFAGYGIHEPALGHDDFAGLDLKGAVVLFMGGVPPGSPWQSAELRERYAGPRADERYDARLAELEKRGARGAIAVEADLAKHVAAREETLDDFWLAAAEMPRPPGPPLARVTPAAAAALLARAGFDPSRPGDWRRDALAGVQATLRTTGTLEPARTANLLAVVPGRDPARRGEAVMIGAHLDHLGMKGGVLHPGADDNASGSAALLEIAAAMARTPPRRTVIIAFWGAEEWGQFGSAWYVRHPAWHLARTVAYLNLDMIAHPWRPEEIADLVRREDPAGAPALLAQATPANFAEPGVATWAPGLAGTLAAAGRGTGMVLHLDRTDGTNGGSDYRGFARRRVPFVRFFGNYFPGYHKPGDTLADIDPAQVERMARLAFATAWLAAEGDGE